MNERPLRSAGARDLAAVVFFGACFTVFFSPVLFRGRYLAAGGDALGLALPAYLRPPSLWEPNVMLGYPWSSNLDGFWDPLAAVLRVLPNTFNLYVLAAYVIAAFGAYRLVAIATGSRVGGTISGITYALGGFMISHLGHYDVVHPAAWTPWVLCAFTSLRARPGARGIAAGACAIALTAAAGQPQVLAYTLALSLAFVIVAAWRVENARAYLGACALTFVAGLGLAAIVLVPGALVAQGSGRARMSYDTFVSYSNPPNEIPLRMFFPYFLGTTHARAYPFSAFGFESWGELSNYAGITPLVLASVAAFAAFRDRMVRFWIAVAFVSLALGAGDGLKLSEIAYRLPILGLFRAQGRHALEFTLAIAILAGYGAAAIRRGAVTRRAAAAAVAAVGGAMAVVLVAVAVLDGAFAREVVARTGFATFPIDPFHNPALGVPTVLFVAGSAAVLAWTRSPTAAAPAVLVVAVVLADLASFAWFGEWHDDRITPNLTAAPPYVAGIRAALAPEHERLMLFSTGATWDELDPDRNLLWDLALTGGRVTLDVARTTALLRVGSDGVPAPDLFEDARDRSLELCAIRYVALPPGSLGMRSSAAPWEAADLGVRIGSAAWAGSAWVPRANFGVRFARPLPASRVSLVTALSDAATIGGGARVAELVLTTGDGRQLRFNVLAGRDTAERGYDRPNVRPLVRHGLARTFDRQGLDRRYVATFALPARTGVAAVDVRWAGTDPAHGYLNLDKLSLVDDRNGVAYPLAPLTLLEADANRWRRVATRAPLVLLENRRRLGRAWLVHRVISATPDDALARIRTGAFDPATTATAEDAPALDGEPALAGTHAALDAHGEHESVRVTALDATHMTLGVRCASRCFVVTSDASNAGWHTTLDDAPVTTYVADYALRGVFVPKGTHVIRFTYFPAGLTLGASISFASATLLGLLALPSIARRIFGMAHPSTGSG